MSIVYTPNAPDKADIVLYRCDNCGKTKSYLSESWSTITIVGLTPEGLVHHCLECRSDKKAWHEPLQ